jgi:hypothetical protein
MTQKKNPSIWNSNWTQSLIVLLVVCFATVQSAKNELVTQSAAVSTSWNNLEPDLLNEFELASHLNPEYKQRKNAFVQASSLEEKIKIAAEMHTTFATLTQNQSSNEIKSLSTAFNRKTTIDIEDYNLNVTQFNTTRRAFLHQWVNKRLNMPEKPLFPVKNS